MEAAHSPREASPAITPLVVPSGGTSSRKRKHAAMSGVNTAAASPAPSERGGTPNPASDTVALPTRQGDLLSRPQLTISRHPLAFIPTPPGSSYCTTEPLCTNRLSFRYTPAGVTGQEGRIYFRTIESNPTCFRVSWEDRSPFVKVTQDGLGLKGEKGFRSARCNVPVREGKWYMEVKIGLGGGDMPAESKRLEGSHVRLGWARREAPLGGPAGLDGYSYAIRDQTGEKVHLSRPRSYGRPFKSGDVVGMYISLPSRRQPSKKDPYDPAHIKRERIPIDFKGQEYFESLEYSQSKEMMALMEAKDRNKTSSTAPVPSSTKKSATVKNLPSTARGKMGQPQQTPVRQLPTLGPQSYIAFFVNGKCQGVAFQDIFDYLPLRAPKNKAHEKRRKDGIREHRENPFDDGSLGYYPFISLFNEAEVTLNGGPDFEFPPPADIDAVAMSENPEDADVKPAADGSRKWRPMCERYAEHMAEQFALDKQEEEELVHGKPLPQPDEEPSPKKPKEAPPKPPPKPSAGGSGGGGAAAAAARESTKDLSDLEKLERHRAKRRAQAAARKERKKREAEALAAQKAGRGRAQADKAQAEQQQQQPEAEAEDDKDDKMLVDDRAASSSGFPTPAMSADTPDTHARTFTGESTVGSVADVQAYWTLGIASERDPSEYNTDFEDAVAGDPARDPEPDIDEELAQIA